MLTLAECRLKDRLLTDDSFRESLDSLIAGQLSGADFGGEVETVLENLRAGAREPEGLDGETKESA